MISYFVSTLFRVCVVVCCIGYRCGIGMFVLWGCLVWFSLVVVVVVVVVYYWLLGIVKRNGPSSSSSGKKVTCRSDGFLTGLEE